MTSASGGKPDGVLVTSSGGTWWAWAGVRIVGATDLTRLGEYRQLDRQHLLQKLLADDRDYLAAHLGGSAALELRWTSEPGHRLVTLDVLARVSAGDEQQAQRLAERTRARLLDVPRHVRARKLLDEKELASALSPLAGESTYGVELRKRWIVQRAERPDSTRQYYVSSPYLRDSATAAWGALVRALAGAPQRVVLSIGLEPVPVPQAMIALVTRRAAEYRRLAEPGQAHGTGLYNDPAQLTADPGAVTAGKLFEDAAQRYSDRAFRFRVSLASDEPLPDSLVTQVREVLSPAEDGDERGFLSTSLVGTVLEPVRPADAAQLELLRLDLDVLGFSGWGSPAVAPVVSSLVQELAPLGELVDVREAAALFRFPYSTDGTLPGFEVVRPQDGTRVRATTGPGTLVLGHQSSPREAVTVPLASLTSHGLVVGTTGSGKTSSVLNLLEQLWGTHEIPFLVLEPVNADRDDYRWLLDRPRFEEMLVLTVGDESLAPFRLNPFEVPRGVRIGTHLSGLVACFDAAFGLTGPLPFLYRKALKSMYTRVGISTDEVSGPRHARRWPRLGDLAGVFAELPDIARYSGEVRSNISAASQLRTESLLVGSCGRTLDATASYPLDELLRRPVVLELAAIGDDDREQALVIALLLNALTAYYKASRKTSQLQHVTVIEEAHRLLRRPGPSSGEGGEQAGRAAEQFANTLAENRKYGESLLIVEQVPSKLIEDAVKNTALKVMHLLPAEEDRTAIADTMNLSEDQQMHGRALDDMTAFVTHRGLGGRATVVDVVDVRGDAARARGLTEDPLPGREVVRERFLQFVRGRQDVWADLAPYEECDGCASRCQFRDIAEVSAPQHAAELRTRLGRDNYPMEPTAERELWDQLAAAGGERATAYDEVDQHQRDDLSACLFLHAARAAFPGRSMAKQVRRYRTAARALGVEG